MPRYHWPTGDLLTHLDIRENLHHRYALLYLSKEAAPRQRELAASLQRSGLTAIPAAQEGHPVVRVRGFDTPEALFQTLRANGILGAGQPDRTEALPEDTKAHRGWRELLKERSIQAAGATYLIADMMPILSGIARKSPTDVRQGAVWATTSVMLLLFGRKNPQHQMGNLYSRMQDYFIQEGLELPDDATVAIEQLKTRPSYLNSFMNFLYEHPVLVNNTLQGYGGTQQIRSGFAQNNTSRKLAGAAVAAGQWGAIAIPENKFAGRPEAEQQELRRREALGEDVEEGFDTPFLSNPAAWLNEKPQRLITIGPILGNVLTGMSAFWDDRHRVNEHFGIASRKIELNPLTWIRDYSRSSEELLRLSGKSAADPATQDMLMIQKGSRYTAISPFFNIAANYLYGISSKEERSVNLDKEGYVDELLDVAAMVYAPLPEAQRGEKLLRFSGFLRTQPDMRLDEKDIKQRLENKIAALEQAGLVHPPASEDKSSENKPKAEAAQRGKASQTPETVVQPYAAKEQALEGKLTGESGRATQQAFGF